MTSSDARGATRLLLGSSLTFAVMALFAKLASARIPGPEVAFVRFTFGSLAVGVAALLGHLQRPRLWRWLFARGFFGGLAVLCYFWAIERAGLGVATLLNYSAPVFSFLFGWWLLGERPRRAALAALLVALTGVVLVTGPQRLLDGMHAGWDGHARGGPWIFLALLSAIFSAAALTAIRAVRRPDVATERSAENSWTVFASFTLLGMVATAPFALPPFAHFIVPTAREWFLLLVMAAASTVAQLLMTRALRHVTAGLAGIVHQLVVVLSLVLGVVVFDERLTPVALAGAALTISGVLLAVTLGSRPRPAA